jgi:hypothetical protein
MNMRVLPDEIVNGLRCFTAADYVKTVFSRYELQVLEFGSVLTRDFIEANDLDTDFKVRGLWRIPYALLRDFDDYLRNHDNQKRAHKAVRAIKAIAARKAQLTALPALAASAAPVAPPVLKAKIWVITYRHPNSDKLRYHSYKTPFDTDRAIARWRSRGCEVISRAAVIKKAA